MNTTQMIFESANVNNIRANMQRCKTMTLESIHLSGIPAQFVGKALTLVVQCPAFHGDIYSFVSESTTFSRIIAPEIHTPKDVLNGGMITMQLLCKKLDKVVDLQDGYFFVRFLLTE